MKLLILIPIIFLAGCMKSVPLSAKFPEAPTEFLQPCPELKKLEKDAKLSDVAKTIVDNYTLYHECSIKNQAWAEWYKAQKNIFEATK